jgi:hypothetical protein
MERMKETVPAQAAGCTIEGGQEAKMEIHRIYGTDARAEAAD